MVWFNLTMPNKTVKKGLKAKMTKLPQMILFLEKQLIKFSCTYRPLPFCKILEKFLGSIQSYDDVSFSGPKWSICQEQNFFDTKHYHYFHLPKKILTENTELWEGIILGPKIVHLPQIFLFKILRSFSFTYRPLSLCKMFKKSSSGSRVMRMRNFWAPIGSFL